jgi:hypothetical protein
VFGGYFSFNHFPIRAQFFAQDTSERCRTTPAEK